MFKSKSKHYRNQSIHKRKHYSMNDFTGSYRIHFNQTFKMNTERFIIG